MVAVLKGKSSFMNPQHLSLKPEPSGINRSRIMLTAPLEKELSDFIQAAKNQRVARVWLESPDFKVYVRKAQRNIEGKMVTTLDIASASVVEGKRGQGIFTRFLNMAHDLNPWDATFIENASDDRFANYFWKRDWELLDDYSRSFYKKKNHGNLQDAWVRSRSKVAITSN